MPEETEAKRVESPDGKLKATLEVALPQNTAETKPGKSEEEPAPALWDRAV